MKHALLIAFFALTLPSGLMASAQESLLDRWITCMPSGITIESLVAAREAYLTQYQSDRQNDVPPASAGRSFDGSRFFGGKKSIVLMTAYVPSDRLVGDVKFRRIGTGKFNWVGFPRGGGVEASGARVQIWNDRKLEINLDYDFLNGIFQGIEIGLQPKDGKLPAVRHYAHLRTVDDQPATFSFDDYECVVGGPLRKLEDLDFHVYGRAGQ